MDEVNNTLRCLPSVSWIYLDHKGPKTELGHYYIALNQYQMILERLQGKII